MRHPGDSGSGSSGGRVLREAALCLLFGTFLLGYFVPYGLGIALDLTALYAALLVFSVVTLAVRLLPGRGPAADDEPGAGPAPGARRREGGALHGR